ncbi:MAG: hypothetical protein R3272_14030 [Candidatus Promineifilaceae bacterium]|nr:hypothetical protein [Candidatus Promineifilaceae bacterium]
MVKRLIDRYQLGDRVEICLTSSPGCEAEEGWVAGRVTAHAFPGIWVETDEGGRWFVTNSRRIRPASP